MSFWATLKKWTVKSVETVAEPLLLVKPAVERAGELFHLVHRPADYIGRTLSGVNELQGGDVLVKYTDGTASNIAIEEAQEQGLWVNKPYWFVHAAFVDSSHNALEMSANGLVLNTLAKHNREYSYEVFRIKKPTVARKVRELVDALAQKVDRKEHAVSYNYWELVKSFANFDKMVTLDEFKVGYDNMKQGKGNEKYYCSQFIVWLSEGARLESNAEKIWGDLASVHVAPSELIWRLKFHLADHWEHVGHLEAGKR